MKQILVTKIIVIYFSICFIIKFKKLCTLFFLFFFVSFILNQFGNENESGEEECVFVKRGDTFFFSSGYLSNR